MNKHILNGFIVFTTITFSMLLGILLYLVISATFAPVFVRCLLGGIIVASFVFMLLVVYIANDKSHKKKH